ncbi:oxidoreductase, short chain dehydrogenase [Melioribacter roseus P3M-2]|uniref:Oxidoreductase, short chain dehydrogenase n=1 Tax=Melioribacter roseus (strain DSM 23840 / JCM 17771 / VKM B-2668 / P3M-2) TaxID=1191523 RepID=I6ZYX5_MELRP|nr:SDR family NAD(P)-dependent oxidoreductase [Melioribacter roseus]AFN74228.1 oxidoreductase, short chain dehydrogenase [Melioribacter roseus P3M-2]
MTFEDKIVLITGASSGIGKALAEKLTLKNCRLILCSRNIERLDLDGGNILKLKCDVSRKEEVNAAYNTAIEKFGKIDIAILNSGVGHRMTVGEYNSQYAEETFSVNLLGMVYWIEKLLPDFIKRREGVIAGVSSLADNRGYSGSGFYCASKAAATIMLEGLRVELKPYGVKVITIKPGFVRTPMTDKNEFKMPFLIEPVKAAEIIVKGIEKEKRIIQFPLPTVLMSKFVGILPAGLYEFLTTKINV